jgi:SAM-dependent methyltransferase
MANATDINRSYYGRLTAGRENYWTLMPAPRMRTAAIVAAIERHKPAVERLCDFGCGNGALLAALAARVPQAALYGVDLSAEQIRENAAQYGNVGWAVADLTADGYSNPFERRCDVAVSAEVIEHLDAPLAYLRNIHASLETGGLLVLTTQSGPVHVTEQAVGHIRHWEIGEMAALLEAAGFRSPEVTNRGFPFHDLSKWAANLRPEVTVRRFGEREWGPFEKATAAVLRGLFRFNSATRGRQLVACAWK